MKAILGFLAFVVLIIFIVVIMVRGGGDEPELTPVPELSQAVATDASFTFTDSGPIVAEEDHAQIRISVSRWTRTIEIVQGYQNTVVASDMFANNEEAFSAFLSALDRAGYISERRTDIETEAGVCPTRHRYVFESDQFGEDFRRWISDCRNTGDFNGNFNTVQRLFRDQIPEYRKFISDARRDTGLRL